MSENSFNSLVSGAWLEEHLDERDLVVLDASLHLPSSGRDAREEFARKHIRGACFFDLASLVDPTCDVPQALPSPSQLAAHLARLGVTPDKTIVFYDDSAVRSAARAWFLCRAHGIGKVAILDGGLAKWKAEGRPLESGERPCAAAEPFTLGKPDNIRFKADVLANIKTREYQLVDARDRGRFEGSVEDKLHNLPGGHIPGASNLPFTELFATDGTYKPAAELAQIFAREGIDLNAPITASCGSGVTASVLLFALELIGHEDNALYDGSWLDWGGDPETPKETGPAGGPAGAPIGGQA